MDDKLEKFDRMQPLIILGCALFGLLIGQNEWISEHMEGLEDPILMVLLFFIFLDIDWKDIPKAFRNYGFTLRALGMNFIFTPLFAWLLSKTVLAGQHELQIALIMLLVMPCTDWYLVFTGITGGNVALSSAILPVQLILQLLLLPVYLTLFVHGGASFDFGSTLIEVFSVAFVPFVLSLLAKFLLAKVPWFEKAESWLDEKGEYLEVAITSAVVITIFASEGQGIFTHPQLYPMIFGALCIFYPVNFVVSYMLGRKLDPKDRISLVFTTTARNSAMSLSLAALMFPGEPLVALALLIGPVTEIPVLVIESWVLRMLKERDARLAARHQN